MVNSTARYWLVTSAFLLLAAVAHSAPVTYNFNGTVAVPVGGTTSVTGSFTLDQDSAIITSYSFSGAFQDSASYPSALVEQAVTTDIPVHTILEFGNPLITMLL